jgi:hypothetical protein
VAPYRLTANRSITGRDRLILLKSLAYAVATIQALDEDRQEWSDRRDMKALVRAIEPKRSERDFIADSVARHAGTRPDFETDD